MSPALLRPLWPILLCCSVAATSAQTCEDADGEDAGGDNCSYYNEFPQHCHCCNTATFNAYMSCCACKSSPPSSNSAYWNSAFRTWPSKATSLIMVRKGLSGSIPTDCDRWPNLTVINLKSNSLSGTLPSCFGSLKKVRTLDVSYNRLQGFLPFQLGYMESLESLTLDRNRFWGPLAPHFGLLSNLQRLSLRYNYYLGGPIPAFFGHLTRLSHLYLDYNQFTELPPEFGNLTRLSYCYMSRNLLTRLPPEIGRLSNLRDLRVAYNQLTGPLPGEIGNLNNLMTLDLSQNTFGASLPPEMGGLSSLRYLYMTNAVVGGSLPPELGDLSLLRVMAMASNALEGSIPAELGRLGSLTSLQLQNNSLSGSLPGSLGDMSSLQYMYLYGNALTGSLPSELGQLKNLRSLQLWANKLTGRIPASFGNLTSVIDIQLQSNNLGGPLPSTLGQLPSLQYLYLYRNKVTGSIPREFGSMPVLLKLVLFENKLSGEIPPELGNLSSLTDLYLDKNSLTGGIPKELCEMPLLERLFLRGNKLSGPVPSELGRLPRLIRLSLTSNEFTGAIPRELANISSLYSLALENNHLNGSIPAELSNLTQLGILQLVGNRLTGHIPPEIGNLSKLRYLYLERNELTGTVPAALSRLTNLFDLGLSSNNLSGVLPSELSGLSSLDSARFDMNKFNGAIPASFGNLSSIRRLYLNNNEFTGEIPAEIGRLQTLEEFRIDKNRLSGSLPAELGNMSALKVFSAHSNDLSGTLPPSLGGLSSLTELRLQTNHFSGGLPADFGNLSALEELHLYSNNLSGALPRELGQLSRLQVLSLHSNRFSGTLPRELDGLSALRELKLSRNEFTGGFPTLNGLQNLEHLDVSSNFDFCGAADFSQLGTLKVLYLQDCCFSDFGGLPTSLTELNMARNRLTTVPWKWMETELPNLKSLLLQSNRISTWNTSMVLPADVFQDNFGVICNRQPPDSRRLPWPALGVLDVSQNPIGEGTNIREFLWSLAYLEQLNTLKAKNSSLAGKLKYEVPNYFVPDWKHTGTGDDDVCENVAPHYPGFRALLELDLSDNRIEAISSPPPGSLVSADFGFNTLKALNHLWWESAKLLVEVNVKNNPDLRLSVTLNEAGSCPKEGITQGLLADPNGWRHTTPSQSECSTLCAGAHVSRFFSDPTLDERVMCRCRYGQGSGQNCTACPDDTFSRMHYTNSSWQRRCHACPAHSTSLSSASAVCFTSCSCDEGYYMGLAGSNGKQAARSTDCLGEQQGQCFKCKPFTTSKTGATQASDCTCDSGPNGIEGLYQKEDDCGCESGFFVDFVSRRCKRCKSVEDCEDFNNTLHPPIIKSGFWATPPPPRGEDGVYAGFSGHSIWRCASAEVCPRSEGAEIGRCEGNRRGRACSLCDAGYYGNPGDECRECTRNYRDSRLVLILIIIVLSPVPLLAHSVLEADADSRGLMLTLRSFRTSLRQMLKFAQVLGVVSLFNVEWPTPVASIFAWFQAMSMDVGALLGIACLDSKQEQTMTLELFFRWVIPFLFALVTCLAAFLMMIFVRTTDTFCANWLPRCSKTIKKRFSMGVYDLVRVLSFFLHLFYVSLLKNGLLPLTCAPSPNGELTLNDWPHIVCWQIGSGNEENFWLVAIVGLVYSVLLITLFPALLLYAWHEAAFSLIHSNYEERGRWGFFFEDFRPTMMRWTLTAVIKDILLNLVIVCFPGLGTAQLLMTAMISTAYGWRVCFDRPYVDMSNTLLEAWSAVAVAAMCFFSAGMGFQSEPEVLDISDQLQDGQEDSVYLQRTYTFIALQALSIAGPCLILGFQLLLAFQCSRRFVPKSMLPIDGERRKGWCQDFNSAMSVEKMGTVLDQLDHAEFLTFRQVIMSSVATVGVVQFDDHKRKGLSRLASKIVRTGSSKTNLGNGKSDCFESEALDEEWGVGGEVFDEKGKEVNPDLPRICVDKTLGSFDEKSPMEKKVRL